MNEYRVIWKREGMRVKRKRYANRVMAERFLKILGPEPWTAFQSRWNRKGPDDLLCCDGHECGCGGVTVRQHHEEARKTIPPIEWVRIEQREVGKWLR